jgi:hypothetical protein
MEHTEDTEFQQRYGITPREFRILGRAVESQHEEVFEEFQELSKNNSDAAILWLIKMSKDLEF